MIMQEIYAEDIGKGFPLVVVHGFLGSSEMWTPQKEILSKYFRVIAPSLPGFGESSKIKSLNSINGMALTVLDLLEKKKINKFNLLGHSMGGMIVQEMAKKEDQHMPIWLILENQILVPKKGDPQQIWMSIFYIESIIF